MALPVSGAISFNDINVELGVSGTTQASLGQSSYRTLAGVPSGAIAMNNFYGKSNAFAFTISSNQTNANLATLATAAGWNGTSKVVATIDSGVYISSNSTGTPALTISGSFPGGVELINNGYVIGMGGAGGGGAWMYTYIDDLFRYSGSPGGGGGTALSVSATTSVTNNGTIGGGGGGGGGGGLGGDYASGGGGGGGRTGTTNSSGGASPGIYPGTAGNAGTSSSAGTGGTGGAQSFRRGGNGGTGGTWGAAGSTGSNGSPQYSWGPGAGGSAGAAVTGNSNITWVATGTRYGSIS